MWDGVTQGRSLLDLEWAPLLCAAGVISSRCRQSANFAAPQLERRQVNVEIGLGLEGVGADVARPVVLKSANLKSKHSASKECRDCSKREEPKQCVLCC